MSTMTLQPGLDFSRVSDSNIGLLGDAQAERIFNAANSRPSTLVLNDAKIIIQGTPEKEITSDLTAKTPAQRNNSSRYKTELCRPFMETGSCRYGEKCQFAHGTGEQRAIERHPKYKTEACRTFHKDGFCPYGSRCHFVHEPNESRDDLPSHSTPPVHGVLSDGFASNPSTPIDTPSGSRPGLSQLNMNSSAGSPMVRGRPQPQTSSTRIHGRSPPSPALNFPAQCKHCNNRGSTTCTCSAPSPQRSSQGRRQSMDVNSVKSQVPLVPSNLEQTPSFSHFHHGSQTQGGPKLRNNRMFQRSMSMPVTDKMQTSARVSDQYSNVHMPSPGSLHTQHSLEATIDQIANLEVNVRENLEVNVRGTAASDQIANLETNVQRTQNIWRKAPSSPAPVYVGSKW